MPSIAWVPVIFSLASFYMYILAINLPNISSTGALNNVSDGLISEPLPKVLGFPSNLAELNELASILSLYKDDHNVYIFVLFCSAYIYKQSFAIPGSVFLNLLAGALWGTVFGFPLACVLTALGATNCYLLSKYFGKHYVIKYFSNRLDPINSKIKEEEDSLFLLLLSLRLIPMAPNWLMNIAAPILNVPVKLFFLSVFFGLIPYNFLCVQAGCFLSEITSTGDIFSWSNTLKLITVAIFIIVPGLLIKKFFPKKVSTE